MSFFRFTYRHTSDLGTNTKVVMQSDAASKNNLMIVIKDIMTSVVTLELDASSVQWLQHR